MNGKGRYLPPRVLQLLGIAIIVGGSIFWAFTGHQSALIIGAGISLVGLGAYSGLRIDITTEARGEGTKDARDPGVEVIERLPE